MNVTTIKALIWSYSNHALHTLLSLAVWLTYQYLDKRESRPWFERLVFVLHLMGHVLLHSFFFKDLLLFPQIKEGTRGDCDCNSILGFRLLGNMERCVKEVNEMRSF